MTSNNTPNKSGDMNYIAGVDIGNSTTEAAIACRKGTDLHFLGSACTKTTGIKGTRENLEGIRKALLNALEGSDCKLEDISVICINEATPVIGALSMSTLTETVITESAMIGHNPGTPGGYGIGSGKTVLMKDLIKCKKGEKVIPVISQEISFSNAAKKINRAWEKNIDVQAAIVQKNDGVLISNRLKKIIPIVDEVSRIQDVPMGLPAIVEVAEAGRCITELSNPYGIASILHLTPTETKKISPIAVSLTGNRSAVVIKTSKGGIKERIISVGKILILGSKQTHEIDVILGADHILQAVEKAIPVSDIQGEAGTAVGGMLQRIKQTFARVSQLPNEKIHVRDLFAADTIVRQKIEGGIAGEYGCSRAIGLAAMVWSDKTMIQDLVERFQTCFDANLSIGGAEIEMAIAGALTTPGIHKPIVVLDMGAGSIDAARLDSKDKISSVHLAGAGDMVTMLIDRELDINDFSLAEDIKICPAAKAESLFHIQLEDGSYKFFKKPLERHLFGRIVLLRQGKEMFPIPKEISLEKLVTIRQHAKKKIFIPNVIRALKRILPAGNIRTTDEVVFLGGSALDFEMPGIVSDILMREYGVVTGRGNIRGVMGPRNAVATGLILSYFRNLKDK
jgi:diol dehydratase reactivase alpha subunit